ncbi:uncharacterized protein CEXT_560121 [Caerostris extrusa]|uniref:Uncharacterized protein n=1 Tax=Caerostris extrusa TaxID=172846 RepID=A0AAV4XSB1_CAEEX|nr:uncharacterized protein CEXT_560121 [Caerostris extrusa]
MTLMIVWTITPRSVRVQAIIQQSSSSYVPSQYHLMHSYVPSQYHHMHSYVPSHPFICTISSIHMYHLNTISSIHMYHLIHSYVPSPPFICTISSIHIKARAVSSVKDVQNSFGGPHPGSLSRSCGVGEGNRRVAACKMRVFDTTKKEPLNVFPTDTPSLTKKNTATNTMKSRHKIKSSRKQNWEIRFLQKLNSEIPLISHDSCTDMVHCSEYLQNSVTNKIIQSAKEPEFMKYWILCLWAWLICLNKIECYHRRHLKRDGRTSNPPTPPRSEDKDALKEALQLLNLGKKTLGLNTEDPDLLIKLVESPNNKRKSEEVQKLLQHPQEHTPRPHRKAVPGPVGGGRQDEGGQLHQRDA